MTKNMLIKYTETKTRVRTLSATVQSGTPLLDPSDSRPAVAITNSGDATKTVTTADIPIGGGVTTLTYPNGGVGLTGKETTLAYDGVWEFADVVSSGTTPAPTSTALGTQVYITSGGALTLVSTGNTAYGKVDYPTDFYKRAGVLPVRIGE
jgi:hypothetical protein